MVKSPPENATLRPSMRTVPVTELAGFKPTTSSSSQSAVPAIAPISWNVPGSSRSATRSRTVSRPREWWKSTLSAPPISFANSV